MLSHWDFQEHGMQVTMRTPLYFAEQGHHVTFVVHSEQTQKPSPRTDLHENIEVCRAELSFRWARLPGRLNRLRQLLLFGLHCWRVLARVCRAGHTPDLIYAAECDAILIGSMLSRTMSLPLVTRYYGVSTQLLANPFQHALYAQSVRCAADLAIITDDGTVDECLLRQMQVRARSLRFWRNGIDLPSADPQIVRCLRKRWGIADDHTILLTISRLYGWKRVDRAIRLLRALVQISDGKFRLVVVGHGPEKDNLMRLCHECGVAEMVHFAGAVPHKDIYACYEIADVFLSLYDMSNVGNPLLEALNAGKCIITLNNGETGSVIRNGENGILLEVRKDGENLARRLAIAVKTLYDDAKLRARLAETARRFGQERLWTWDERLKVELQTLVDLVQQRRKIGNSSSRGRSRFVS